MVQMAVLALGLGPATAAQADKVLLFGPSVNGGAASVEAQHATAQGFEVDVVDAPTWASMTTEQFAAYRAIVIGDNDNSTDPADVAAAENNASVWGAAVSGNVIIAGADVERHYPSSTKFLDRALAFAAATPGHTGAYVAVGNYYRSQSPNADAKVLDAFGAGAFKITTADIDDIHIDPATVPAPSGLNDGDLSGWGNTAHSYLNSFPGTFRVFAVSLDPAGTYTTSDGQTGFPSFLVSERTPPVSAASSTCTGAVSFTNTDDAGVSGSRAVHYRLDGGAEQTLPTTGDPGAASLMVPAGTHALEFWGEDQLANLEQPHHNQTVFNDPSPPTVVIASDQKRSRYNAGARASITTVASDSLSKLATDPSRAGEPLPVRHAGVFTVTKTAVDQCANKATATFRYAVAPVNSRPRLSPSAFPAALEGGSIARRKTGTTISYRSSDRGKTLFRVYRALPGFRRGSKCVASAPKGSRKRCTRFLKVRGSFRHKDRAGRNRFRFTGRVGRRTLQPGKYRLDAAPTAARRKGRKVSSRFRIKP